MMNLIKKFLSWVFAVSALLCIWNALKIIFHMIHRHYGFFTARNLLLASLFPVLVIILAMAWWTVWKRRPSGKGWGIAASLTYVLLPVWSIHSSRSLALSLGAMLALGVIGLVVFIWPAGKPTSEDGPLLD
jgi:ABC-type proline/glycine betaine transport system permease subunit